ncbi:MAG TPA: hypothetical protein VGV41_12470 [Pseudolabrys sp.]|uniref:hypothetical protein n=1 Tax=Pseudolabrys sp. TaxID=1960880 RepID=UPI002DDD8CBF|nr:hypothetical protein [Pseudolabrys sp.]HEV2629445.1 hypothetical protein [Pseudolabrys sp.]
MVALEPSEKSGAVNVESARPKPRGRPFQKGNGGRRRGSRNRLPRDLKQIIADDMPAIIEKLRERALGGNTAAAVALLRTLIPPAVSEPILIEIPTVEKAADAVQAIAAVIRAVTAGQIAPDAGEQIVGLIERQSRVLEVADLERRLVEIERQQGKTS